MELLSQEEGEDLLKLTRYALSASQGKLCMLPRIQRTPRLKEHRGVFVGFQKEGVLRGCIGSVSPGKALEESVVELTLKSALKDPRFAPLSADEIPQLTLEISILSPLMAIEITEIQIGVHGLLVAEEERIGLLLPSVALENRWDVPTFLNHTCLKGGMQKQAWRFGAAVSAFTTQVFKGKAQIE